MAKLGVLYSATAQSQYVFIQAATKTDGTGATGLSATSTDLIAGYIRERSAFTTFSLTTGTAATAGYATGLFFEVDSTNAKGLYRLDAPDACYTATSTKTVIFLKIATATGGPSAFLSPLEFEFRGATEISAMTGAGVNPHPDVAMQFIYQSVRNRRDSGTATQNLYTDGGSVFATATQSDSGSLFVKGKFG